MDTFVEVELEFVLGSISCSFTRYKAANAHPDEAR